MNRLFLINIIIIFLCLIFVGCRSVLQKIPFIRELSSAPNENRVEWKKYQTIYNKDIKISFALPMSEKYPEPDYLNLNIINDNKKNELNNKIESVFRVIYDVDEGYGFPQLDVWAEMFYSKKNLYSNNFETFTKQLISEIKEKNKTQDIQHKIIEKNKRQWLVVYWLSPQGFIESERYWTRINEKTFFVGVMYGPMANNKKWLESRKKTAEDIFNSIKIEMEPSTTNLFPAKKLSDEKNSKKSGN